MPASKPKPDLNIAVTIDEATLENTDSGKLVSLKITIKNVSLKKIQYEMWSPSDGIIIYIVFDDGGKKPVYPFDPSDPLIVDLRHVEHPFLAPGASNSYTINIPCTTYPQLHGHIVASINVFHNEVFSEPFELPDLN